MNLRHWQHFLRIAEAGNFSRASERLGVAQPVLSREMRELETTIGTPLFRRHGRGVILTPAGDVFRRRAETILQQIERVPAEIVSTAGEPAGSLSVALPPSIAGLISLHAFARFRRLYPGVRLRIREGTSTQVRDAILMREAEIGVLSLPLAEPQIALEPLFSEPMMLIGPSGMARKRAFSIQDLGALPLILGAKPNSARIIVEHAMEAVGLACNPVIETDVAPIADFIRHGLGYSVAPACFTIGRWPHDLTFGPVEGLRIAWATASLRASELSIAGLRMLEIIQDIAATAAGGAAWDMRYTGPQREAAVA